MQKAHIKKNDMVVVISGSHKGKSGKVLEIHADKNRATVEGVAMIKKHLKKSQENPQGKILEREGSIHVSNLMLQSRFDSSKRAKKTESSESTKASGTTKSSKKKTAEAKS
jgi:large subunit ribosomal protein L24